MLVHELMKCPQLALFLLFAFYLDFLLQRQHTNQELVSIGKSWQTQRLRRHQLGRRRVLRYHVHRLKCLANSEPKVNIKSSSKWLQIYLACETSVLTIFEKATALESCPAYIHSLLELVSLPLQQRGYTTYKESFFAPSHINAG
jgi:hypothetical protein